MQINTIPVADTEARSRIIPFIAAFVFLTVYLYSQYYALHSFLSAHQPVLLYSLAYESALLVVSQRGHALLV
jgi:hypothetical protein